MEEHAPPPAEEAPVPPEVRSPEALLEASRAARFAGDGEAALAALEELLRRADAGESVPTEVRARAQLELGRLQYILGDHVAARGTFGLLLATPRELLPFDIWKDAKLYVASFYYEDGEDQAGEATLREVLTADIQAEISVYEHSPDLCSRFDLLRGSMLADRQQQLAAVKRPLRWWGFAPFGVPQFQQDRPIRGATYALLQTSFAATSIGTWVWIRRLEAEGGGDHKSDTVEEAAEAQAQIDRARALRSGLSFPTAAAFYLTWGASVLDGGLDWRRQGRVELGVGVIPGPDGGAVVIGGRF